MDAYSQLRHFADSWGLLGLATTLLLAWAFAFRPGARAVHDDARAVPFRHDEAPAPVPAPPSAPALRASCGACATCTCGRAA